MIGERKHPRRHRRLTVSLALLLGLAILGSLWRVGAVHASEAICLVEADCPADYGDLPGPVAPSYGTTLLADNGARHYFVANDVILGARRDADNNGHEDLAAAGDDYTGGMDDEDGVSLSGVWAAGPAGGQVWVAASGAGCLTAWLDYFPADFDFDDPGEKIFDNHPVAAGTHLYSFPLIEAPAAGVNLYARFRLVPAVNGSCAEAQIVGLAGPAQGGEVEDYLWNYTPTAITLQATDTTTAATLPLWLALAAIGLTVASATALRRQPIRVEANV